MGEKYLDARVEALLKDPDLIKKLKSGQVPFQDVFLLIAVADARPEVANSFLRDLHNEVMATCYDGNKTRYSKAIGISRETLRQRILVDGSVEPEVYKTD